MSETRQIVTEKLTHYVFVIGEGAVSLAANLLIMIFVERRLGTGGLGNFSYFLSFWIISGVVFEFGIPRHVEREMAVQPDSKASRSRVLISGTKTALLLSTLALVFFLGLTFLNTSNTKVEEKAVGYLFIGLSIALRNLSELKIAVLQADGRHDTVAALKLRRLLTGCGAIFALLLIGVSPAYLMIGYFIGEAALLWKARETISLSLFKALGHQAASVRETLRRGADFMLTDDTLDSFLYTDFLILGFYVSSTDLGVYAQASILARCFLLAPVSIKPIFRKRYCSLAGRNEFSRLSMGLERSMALLFSLHAILGLYLLVYFPQIAGRLFRGLDQGMNAFVLFVTLLPGLLVFSATVVQEPIYEALGKVQVLQNIVLTVIGINLLLNLFMIPFAGAEGAAWATSLSMLAYFLAFGFGLAPLKGKKVADYIFAGAAAYLVYILFRQLDLSGWISFWLMPVLFLGVLWSGGFFQSSGNPRT